MLMKQKSTIKNVILLLDIICIIITYFLSAFIREGILQKNFFKSLYGITFFFIILAYIVVFISSEDNERYIFKRGFAVELWTVAKEQVTVGLVLLFFLFATQQGANYSRFFFLLFFLLNILLTYVVRLYFKLVMLTLYKNSSYSSKVMLVTTRSLAKRTIKRIREENMWNTQLVALCIIDQSMTGKRIEGIEVTSDAKTIYEDVMLGTIDEMFMNIPTKLSTKLENLILTFEKMGIVVHIIFDVYPNLNLDQKRVGRFGGYQVVSFATNMFNVRQVVLKKMMDVAGGLVGCVITVLLTVVLAPFIYLESPGPIFFTQTRVGKNGRRFKIFKFRSMCIDAEERKTELLGRNEMDGLMFKIENDPRVTRIGKFLRRTSLDEFPQFLNVLKGDMSLVGTRPPTVDEFERYEPEYKRRLSIRPGLTGLWQVSGRSDIKEFEEVVKLDLEYIDNWSLGQDLKIIMKTLVVMLFGKGAK